MMKGKCKNLTNRIQGYMASSEPSSPTAASPVYPNTPEKQDLDLKITLMMLIEDFKKDIINSLKEIQENTSKPVEALKEETQKALKELQENNQIGEGIEQNHPESKNGNINKKSQKETILEIEKNEDLKINSTSPYVKC
jgi:ribosome recycling factor